LFAVLPVFLLVLFPAPALGRRDSVPPVTGARTEVSDMFFEILRFDVTGVSDFPDIAEYAGVSTYPAQVLLHIIWQNNLCPVYLIEKAVPSYTGKLDSTFCAQDFLKTENYDWIDDIVDEAASEKAGQAVEALEMQPPEEIAQAEQESTGDTGEKAEESPAERRYRDSEGRLRLYSYDTEYLSVAGNTDSRILISAAGKNASRKYYDSLMRLVKKEKWSIADTSAQSALLRTDVYYYNADEGIPFSSVTVLAGERIETLYNEKGLVYSQTDYSVDENSTRRMKSRTLWKYNDNNKITEESYTRFLYSTDSKPVQTGSTTRKEVYEYTEKGSVPDYFYYEDGTLRMKTVYTDNDTYTTTLYFDEDLTVTAEYRHGRKTEETFIRGKNVIRSRVYEK
jgi:hypothetical protein